MLKTWFAAAAIMVLAQPVAALAAEHVVNGGFETGDFTGYTESDPYGGDPNLVGVDGGYTHSGNYAAYLGTEVNNTFGTPTDTITLSQSFATVAGQQYDFSFYLSNGPFDLGPNPQDSFTAAFNGSNLLTLINQPASLYNLFTYRVTAAGASSTISFNAANIPGYWNLDDVSVTDVAVVIPGVPEPAAWAMLIGGFGMAGGAMRRRRAGSALPA